jgi:hypothetical protein
MWKSEPMFKRLDSDRKEHLLDIRGEQGCQMVYFQMYQKYQTGYILESLEIVNVVIFNCHFEYFTAILNILPPLGIFYHQWGYF